MIRWRKSSRSSGGTGGNDCVEVGHGAGIRDSKNTDIHIKVKAETWAAFLRTVKQTG